MELITFYIILKSFFGGPSHQTIPERYRGEEIVSGILSSTSQYVNKDSQNQSLSGNTVSHYGVNIMEKTDTIKGEIGLLFGTQFEIKSEKDEYLTTKRTWTFPIETEMEDGRKTKSSTRTMHISTNSPKWTYYTIENENEIIPGEWSVQYVYKGKVIYFKRFYMK